MAKNNDIGDDVEMRFGKYAGQTPEAIAKIDPGYVVWLYEESPHVRISRALYLACSDSKDASLGGIDSEAGIQR